MENELEFNRPVSSNVLPSSINESQQWVLGDACLSPDIIFPDGHGWLDFFPIGERQSGGDFDSTNCTNYSLLNCVEAIGNKKFNGGKEIKTFQNNLSERERGIRSGTTQGGNTLHNVCECLRNQGVIPEAFLPFSEDINSWQKYYSPNPLPFDLWKVAESWKKKYGYKHDWVFLPGESISAKQEKMKIALRSSPLTVSGYAWSRHSDGLYYSDGFVNHAFDIADYVEGQYWIAVDSYADETGSFIKKLDWNFNFYECKRHHLEKKVGGELSTEPKYIEYIMYRMAWFVNKKA